MLRLLDLEALTTKALEYANANFRSPDQSEVRRYVELRPTWAPYAMADTDHGLYVVNREGVGFEVTDERGVPVDFHGKWEDSEGRRRGSITPTVVATLSPAEVRELAGEEEVDLADLVRAFGDRLETNFRIWHRTINKEA
jgi:hypothetical protein